MSVIYITPIIKQAYGRDLRHPYYKAKANSQFLIAKIYIMEILDLQRRGKSWI